MTSASPVDPYGPRLGGSAPSADGSGQSDSGKSPLSMSLGFLKTLTEKKNTRGKRDRLLAVRDFFAWH